MQNTTPTFILVPINSFHLETRGGAACICFKGLLVTAILDRKKLNVRGNHSIQSQLVTWHTQPLSIQLALRDLYNIYIEQLQGKGSEGLCNNNISFQYLITNNKILVFQSAHIYKKKTKKKQRKS